MRGELQAQVVIVGAGPCGITLANHLGALGVSTVLLDRDVDVLDYPRAVGVDDEALRSWQSVGLAEKLIADMVQNPPVRYHNSRGRCFAKVRPQAQPYGWPRRNMFLQPLTERALREGAARYACVDQRLGCEVTGFTQSETGVAVFATGPDGTRLHIDCEYLVGADGGRSTVRKGLGIELIGHTHTSKWLVVDVEGDELDAPFSGVYCDPLRPHMSIDLPYGHRRYEFMLLDDDDEAALQQPDKLEDMLRPHYPPGTALPRIKRSRVYLHHSRIAERFGVDRVFIAGDAAHLQPPFFGQGMNSGLRDATNLGWKLAAVLAGRLPRSALATYESERRGHALAMVKFATWIGRLYRPRNRATEFMRDMFFRAAQAVPSLRDYVLQLRFKPMPKYESGILLRGGIGGLHPAIGTMFIQPLVRMADGGTRKLDDAIGNRYALIGINTDPSAALSDAERAFWVSLDTAFIQINRSRAGAHLLRHTREDTLVLDDVSGAFRDWAEMNAPNAVILLRPDRYVAAVCAPHEVAKMTEAFGAMLSRYA